MSLISFTPVVDGSTAVAAGVNTPLSTIFNDYNGNITDANIASGAAIAGSKISPATLPISGLVQTQANAGTGGGTIYYLNLGGLKLCWGTSSVQGVGAAGASLTITLPTSFFASIQAPVYSPATTVTDQNQKAVGISYTTTTLTYFIQSGTNGSTQSTTFLVIGT